MRRPAEAQGEYVSRRMPFLEACSEIPASEVNTMARILRIAELGQPVLREKATGRGAPAAANWPKMESDPVFWYHFGAMICVSIGNVSSRQARDVLHHCGAEMAELRLDLIERPDLPKLLSGRRPPVIVTNRPEREGGKYRGGEEERLRSLEKAMDLGAEYVDIEWDSVEKLARRENAKIIVSRHDFRSTPEDIGEWLEEMRPKGDVVKIVTQARDIADNFRVLDLLEHARTPTVAFCMGEAGAVSRLLAPAYGAAWTYAAVSKEEATAPGQFSLEEMRDLYRVPEATRSRSGPHQSASAPKSRISRSVSST